MPRIFVDDDTLRVQIAGYGIVEDGHPVDVPPDVAADLKKCRRLKFRVEENGLKPRLAPKKTLKEG